MFIYTHRQNQHLCDCLNDLDDDLTTTRQRKRRKFKAKARRQTSVVNYLRATDQTTHHITSRGVVRVLLFSFDFILVTLSFCESILAFLRNFVYRTGAHQFQSRISFVDRQFYIDLVQKEMRESERICEASKLQEIMDQQNARYNYKNSVENSQENSKVE